MINIMGVPLLSPDPPPLVSDIVAKDLMNTKVVSFPSIVSVHYILEVLGRVKHQGFPVINESNEIEVSCLFFHFLLFNSMHIRQTIGRGGLKLFSGEYNPPSQ